MNVYDTIVIQNQKSNNMEIKEFAHINLHLKDGLGMEFTAL